MLSYSTPIILSLFVVTLSYAHEDGTIRGNPTSNYVRRLEEPPKNCIELKGGTWTYSDLRTFCNANNCCQWWNIEEVCGGWNPDVTYTICENSCNNIPEYGREDPACKNIANKGETDYFYT